MAQRAPARGRGEARGSRRTCAAAHAAPMSRGWMSAVSTEGISMALSLRETCQGMCVEAGTRCRPRHGLQPAADDGASTPASLDAAADPDPKVQTRTEWQSLVGWISCFCSWPWFSSSLLAERLVVGRVDCAVGALGAAIMLRRACAGLTGEQRVFACVFCSVHSAFRVGECALSSKSAPSSAAGEYSGRKSARAASKYP